MIMREEAPAALGAPASTPAGPQASSPANVVALTPKDRDFVTSLTPAPIVLPPRDADAPNVRTGAPPIRFQQDAPSCSDCGSIMVRNGACYKCLNCGSTSGCS